MVSLSEEITSNLAHSIQMLARYRKSNAEKRKYLEGKNSLSSLSIFLPVDIADVGIALPWARLAVTALHDRMELDAIVASDAEERAVVDELVDSNYLHSVIRECVFDSLTYGCGYLLAGYGDVSKGEPYIKATVESPDTTFGVYDTGSRTLTSLVKIKVEPNAFGDEIVTLVELYLPEVVILLSVNGINDFDVVDVKPGFGFIPAVKLINAEDGSIGEGTSEINHVLRSLIDYGYGVFSNMRVSSDSFASPQQFIVGVGNENIQGAGIKPGNSLSRKAGTVWTIDFERDGDGEVVGKPEVGQLPSSSPSTYISLAEQLVKQISIATRIPVSQVGLGTDYAASADAIKSMENPFVLRIEKKEKIFAEPIEKFVRILYRLRTGEQLKGKIAIKWLPAGTQTLAADVDALLKAVQAGSISPTSDYAYDLLRVPYSQREKERQLVEQGKQPQLVKSLIEAARSAAASSPEVEAASTRVEDVEVIE